MKKWDFLDGFIVGFLIVLFFACVQSTIDHYLEVKDQCVIEAAETGGKDAI